MTLIYNHSIDTCICMYMKLNVNYDPRLYCYTITDLASKLPATFFTLSVESSKTICMTTVYKIKR